MDEIKRIRDLDDAIFEQYEEYQPKIFNSKFSKQYPNTHNLCTLYSVSTNFIKNSIFDCAQNDDFFSTMILYRSLIEHYLRFKYIWFNWIKNKNDIDSENYIKYGEAIEVLEIIKSKISKHKLSCPTYKIDNWNELLAKFPSLKNYSKNEIEEESLKFSYKNIIKTLKEIDQKNEKDTSFLGNLILEYSRLSSFVHGGIGSYHELMEFEGTKDRQKEYERICGLSFQLSATVKLFSLILLVQTDRDLFENYYLKIDKIMKELNN